MRWMPGQSSSLVWGGPDGPAAAQRPIAALVQQGLADIPSSRMHFSIIQASLWLVATHITAWLVAKAAALLVSLKDL